MNITRRSNLTGKTHTRDIPNLNEEQLAQIESRGETPIQFVAPYLSPDDREFFITGITPEEWNSVFGKK